MELIEPRRNIELDLYEKKAEKSEKDNKAHFLHPVVTLVGGLVGRGWPLALSTISSTWMEGKSNCRQETTKQGTIQMEQAAQFEPSESTQNRNSYFDTNVNSANTAE